MRIDYSQMPIDDLVKLVKLEKNNKKAFDQLFKKCYEKAKTLLHRSKYTFYEDDIEDILMEYFGNYFLKSIERFNYKSSFWIYIQRIIRLRTVNYVKELIRHKHIPLDYIYDSENDNIQQKYIKNNSNLYNVTDNSLIFYYYDMIKRLIKSIYNIVKPEHRLALLCRIVIPYKGTEISNVLTIKEKTLYTWTYRGIRELKQHFENIDTKSFAMVKKVTKVNLNKLKVVGDGYVVIEKIYESHPNYIKLSEIDKRKVFNFFYQLSMIKHKQNFIKSITVGEYEKAN